MFEINHIFFKKRNKELYKNFSFRLNEQEIMTCLYNKRKEKKMFLNMILGRDYPYRGSIYLNKQEITTYGFQDRKIALIKSRNFFISLFVPAKFKLVWSALINPLFIYQSFSNYYLKLLERKITTARNEYQINLLIELNKLFKEFIPAYINIKINSINKFLDEIHNLHIKNTELLLKDKTPDLTKKWISTYLFRKSEILINQSMLVFLQAIFDVISSFKELRLSCDCEKSILNKTIKTKIPKKEFYYTEINCTIDEQLKWIGTQIIKKRFDIISLQRKIKLYKYIILKNMKEYNVEKNLKKQIKKYVLNIRNRYIFSKKNKDVNSFQFAKDLEQDFLNKEKITINNVLYNDFLMLKNKSVELIHEYHKNIINNDVENISKKEYKLKLKLFDVKYNKKAEFQNIFSVMNEKSKKISMQLGITHNNIFSANFFSVYFSKIITFIINALVAEKEIIILDKIFDKILLKEQEKLKAIINKIFIFYPKVKIFIISNRFLYNNNYQTKYLLLTDYSNLIYDKTDFSKKYIAYPENIWMYKSIFRLNTNFISTKYKKDNDLKKYLAKIDNLHNKIICINPLLIKFKQTSELDFSLTGKIKSIHKKSINFYLIKFKVDKSLTLKILTETEFSKNDFINKVYLNKNSIIFYDKAKK